jgi:hypothetical protein
MLTRQRTEALVVRRPVHFAAQSARRTQLLHSIKPGTLEEQVGRVQIPGKNKPTWPKRASYGHGGGATRRGRLRAMAENWSCTRHSPYTGQKG